MLFQGEFFGSVFVGVVYILLSIAGILYILHYLQKFKNFSVKDTIVYPLIVIFYILFLFLANLFYVDPEGKNLFVTSLVASFSDFTDVLTLALDSDLFMVLKENSITMAIAYVAIFATSALSLIALVFLVMYLYVNNLKKRYTFWKSSEQIYILGLNEDAKAFLGNLDNDKKSSVKVILKLAEGAKYFDEKLMLDEYGISYYVYPYASEEDFDKTLDKLLKKSGKQYTILSFFDEDKENYDFLSWSRNYIDKNQLAGRFFVQDNTMELTLAYQKKLDELNAELKKKKQESDEAEKKLAEDKNEKKLNEEEKKKLEVIIEEAKKAPEKLFNFYKEEADKGIYEAMYQLALCYNKGDGITKDTKLANEYLKKATAKEYSDLHVQFIISAKPDQVNFLTSMIHTEEKKKYFAAPEFKKALDDQTAGLIRVFSKYDLLGYQFLKDYSFSQYVTNDILDDGTIGDIDINLFMIGFGKVNQHLLTNILITNQFMTKIKHEDGTFSLAPKRMNVYAYDKEDMNSMEISSGIMKYKKSDYTNPELYYELPLDFASHFVFEKSCTGEMDFTKKIYNIIKGQSDQKHITRNFFIVSVGTDYENNMICSELKRTVELIPESQTEYFIRTKDDIILSKDKDIHYFGKDSDIMSYENVIADELYLAAKKTHLRYAGTENEASDRTEINLKWATNSALKQKSNLYTAFSLYFKTPLLKLTEDKVKKFAELYVKTFSNGNDAASHPLSDYPGYTGHQLKFDIKEVLAVIEHEKWNAFEMSEGVLPYKKSLALPTEKSTSFSNKSDNERYHLCFTTAKGLVDMYNELLECSKQYPKLDIGYDTILYDYEALSNLLDYDKHLHFIPEELKK